LEPNVEVCARGVKGITNNAIFTVCVAQRLHFRYRGLVVHRSAQSAIIQVTACPSFNE